MTLSYVQKLELSKLSKNSKIIIIITLMINVASYAIKKKQYLNNYFTLCLALSLMAEHIQPMASS